MYSMVLMAALTAGGSTPYCHGCCGCWGGGWGGGYGGWGGGYGGWGGGYGGWGGGYGCYGGCYGCFGGCMGCYGGGGYGGWGGYGAGAAYPGTIYGGTMAPGATAPGTAAPYGEPLPPPTDSGTKKKEGTMRSNKAKLVVELPPNAKLYIDDKPMKNASGVRSFNTPELEPGQAYYYIVRVETERDGKPVSETRRVVVRAGQVARADFKDMRSDAVRTAQAK